MRSPSFLSANRWHLASGVVALVWANLPTLTGYGAADLQTVFSGFFIFPQDGFSYLAKMQQGAAGSWLFHLPFTTEAHPGAWLYPFYLTLGKATSALGLSMIGGYHLARLVSSVALLACAGRFLARFAVTQRGRFLSWTMILAGGGTDWLLSSLKPSYVAFTAVTPDVSIFSVLYGPPHVTAALALLLWILPTVPDLFIADRSLVASPCSHSGRRRWIKAWLLGLGGLVMSLIRPDYVPILYGVLIAYWLSLALKRRQILGQEAALAGAICLPAFPYALLVVATFRTNPAMAGWAEQNPLMTPPLDDLLAGIGLFLLPAVLGVVQDRWWHDDRRLLLVAWAAVLPLLLYSPLPLQRRLVGGVQVALAVPAGHWIDQHALPWLGKARWRTAVFGPLLASAACLLFSYPLLFVWGAVEYVATRPETLFLTADEIAALDWLKTRPPGLVVMAAEDTGRYIPAYSRAIPVLGHPVETLAVEEKRADVSRFFAADTPAADRLAILNRYSAAVIWRGPRERRLGSFDPAILHGYLLGFEQGPIKVWISSEEVHDGW